MKHLKTFKAFLNESSDMDKRKALKYKPALMLQNQLLKKFSEIEKLVIYENNFAMYIETIIIKDEFKRKGIGTKIFSDIFDYADKTNKIVTLYPDDQHGTDREDLEIFYRKLGFDYNMDLENDDRFGDEDMIRYPNK